MSRLSPRNKFISRRSSVMTLMRSSSSWLLMRRADRRQWASVPLTPSRFCMIGLVVVYCRNCRFSGNRWCWIANAASAASWKPLKISFFFPGYVLNVADRKDPRGRWSEIFSVSTVSAFFSSSRPHSAIGTQLRMQPEECEHLVGGHLQRGVAVIGSGMTSSAQPAGRGVTVNGDRMPLDQLHFSPRSPAHACGATVAGAARNSARDDAQASASAPFRIAPRSSRAPNRRPHR